jgi:hypothetical protein
MEEMKRVVVDAASRSADAIEEAFQRVARLLGEIRGAIVGCAANWNCVVVCGWRMCDVMKGVSSCLSKF